MSEVYYISKVSIELCTYRHDLISAWSFRSGAPEQIIQYNTSMMCWPTAITRFDYTCLLHRGYLTPRRSRQTQLIYLSRIRGSCQEQANRRFSPCNSTIARAMAAANCFLCGISSQCWSYTTSYTLMELDYASSWFKPDCAHQQNILVIAQWDCGWYGWYISSPSSMHDSLCAYLFKMVLCMQHWRDAAVRCYHMYVMAIA